MAEGLKIVIGAEINQLQNKLSKATRLIDNLKKEQKKLSSEFEKGNITQDKYYSSLTKNTIRLKNITNASKRYSNELTKSADSTKKLGNTISGNALPATQEFSRVIQDAPFGIQGVGNNIQQLTSVLGNLSRSTDATTGKVLGMSGAIKKTLLGAISGPGALIFAVSAITTLLTVFSDKLKLATSDTKKLAEATKEYVSQAITEVSQLETLLKISRDESASKQVREGALKRINDKYGEYLGNLNSETVATDKVAKSVKNLSLALVQKAKLQGLEKLITEKTEASSEDLIKAELDKAEALKVLDTQLNKTIQGNAIFRNAIGDVEGTVNKFNAFLKLAKQNNAVGEAARNAGAGIGVAKESFVKAKNRVKELNTELDNTLKPLLKLDEELKRTLFQQESGAKLQFDQPEIVLTNGEKPTVEVDVVYRPKDLTSSGATSEGFNIAGQIQSQIPLVTANMGLLADELERIKQDRIEPIVNGISGVFADLGSNIANSLSQSSGIFGAFVGTIIQQSLKLVSQLITASIKSAAATKAQVATVVTAEKAKASASAISAASQSAAASGPGGAFLLPVLIGGALAAISSAFSGIGSSGGGATSGVSGATSSGGATSFGSSSSASSFNGRVVFEIAGDKLIGVLNNTSLGNLRVGDSDQLITTG